MLIVISHSYVFFKVGNIHAHMYIHLLYYLLHFDIVTVAYNSVSDWLREAF